MKLIPLTLGQFAKVDDADFKRFGRLQWKAIKKKNGYYAMREPYIDGIRFRTYLHRLILGDPLGELVDHKNRNPLDCRKKNLRICNRSQNAANRSGAQPNSKSGIRGVSWGQYGKWRAYINVNDRTIALGSFSSAEEASKAYARANRKHFGQFGGVLK